MLKISVYTSSDQLFLRWRHGLRCRISFENRTNFYYLIFSENFRALFCYTLILIYYVQMAQYISICKWVWCFIWEGEVKYRFRLWVLKNLTWRFLAMLPCIFAIASMEFPLRPCLFAPFQNNFNFKKKII